MKCAVVNIAAYYVSCPHCGYDLIDPGTGSFLIGRDSVDAFKGAIALTAKNQLRIVCHGCGETYLLPAPVVALGA